VLVRKGGFFLESASAIDAKELRAALATHDARTPIFLGHSIVDTESSIVHHYDSNTHYPLALSGFALSWALVGKLARELEATPLGSNQQIEPVFELAKWIQGPSIKVPLTHFPSAFCTERAAGCATWVRSRDAFRPSFGLGPDMVTIAVKTVGALHKKRIPVLNELWGKSSTAEVLYLSNETFTEIKGVQVVDLSPEFGDAVNPAVESTEQGSGHCSKMESMLKWLYKHRPGKRWYVVTDDDTLVNVPRLLRVLDSHDHTEAIYMGERYGWAHAERRSGTNYMTTGAGMVLSAPALAELQRCSHCTCSRPNSPDDMTLGGWMQSLGNIKPVHEEGFHQSEPHNYNDAWIRYSDTPITFHRFGLRFGGTEEKLQEGRIQNWKTWSRVYFNPDRAWGKELPKVGRDPSEL